MTHTPHDQPLSDDAGARSPQNGQAQSMEDAAEMLWVVLANVSGGDWTKQTPEWQEVAARWRDNYFKSLAALRSPHPETVEALKVIHKTVRGDEKSECWTIRAYLDKRGIFNDDIGSSERLIEEVCKYALAAIRPPQSDTVEHLRALAKKAIERELPEDEPDTIPDWCYDTIIAALRPSASLPVEEEKDHGAGLIHQVASPLAETEPRPDWMIRRLEHLQAQYRCEANDHRRGSFKQSESLCFAVSLEYALAAIYSALASREQCQHCDRVVYQVGSGNPPASAKRAPATSRSAAPETSSHSDLTPPTKETP